jgi:hypothetical protein
LPGSTLPSAPRRFFNNDTGEENRAFGYRALYNNHGFTGFANSAFGTNALLSNVDGQRNSAFGNSALASNVHADGNTAIGVSAGVNIDGDGNVCIGSSVGGEAGVNDSTYIRNVNTLAQNFSAGVNNYVTVRLTDGRLGNTSVVSSRRYKEDIKSLDKTSEALYALKPVSFRLKKEYDDTQALGFGLIAEEVEKVNPALVYRNNKGQVESVRYDMINAMLLNEFLKAHRKMEEQEATIAQLKADGATQQTVISDLKKRLETVVVRLEEQDSKIERVNDRLELHQPVPQVAVINH